MITTRRSRIGAAAVAGVVLLTGSLVLAGRSTSPPTKSYLDAMNNEIGRNELELISQGELAREAERLPLALRSTDAIATLTTRCGMPAGSKIDAQFPVEVPSAIFVNGGPASFAGAIGPAWAVFWDPPGTHLEVRFHHATTLGATDPPGSAANWYGAVVPVDPAREAYCAHGYWPALPALPTVHA